MMDMEVVYGDNRSSLMRTWTPLWSPIVDSSIWDEPDYVCKIWITMLALKDSDDICRANAYQLAKRARKSEEEVLQALSVLSSPDARRLEPQEYEGRRIKAVEDGWLILNAAKYRDMMQKEMERARWRRAQAVRRAKDRDKEKASRITSMPSTASLPSKKIAENTEPPDDYYDQNPPSEAGGAS